MWAARIVNVWQAEGHQAAIEQMAQDVVKGELAQFGQDPSAGA
jgi:hypothetical protein